MRYFFTLCALLAPFLGLAQVPSFVPTNGLVAWYGMNNSPNDLSGNGNNATLNGGVTAIADRNGNPNSAYSFNGTNGNLVVQTPSFQFSPTGQFTYSVWIRRATTAGVPLIMATTAANNFISMIGGTGDMRFGTNKQQSAWIWATTTYTMNQWEHYVAVYNNASMTFYKNGQVAATATYTHTGANTATLPLYIGSGINTQFFNGSLDDFGVWTRALSANEVEQLFQGCAAGISSQPRDTSVVRGSNIRLVSSSIGSGVSYQWQRNGAGGWVNLSNGGLFSGVTTDTLSITGADFTINNNQFRCLVSAASCSDTSDVATVTIRCNQQLSNQPLSTTRDMNTTALFTTSSFDPASAYQWQVDSTGTFVNLTNGGQYSGVNDDSLRINNLRVAQTGHRFRCILSNSPCSDTTTASTLTVVNTTSVEENSLLQLEVYPNPTNEYWYMSTEPKAIGSTYYVVDGLGRKILEGKITAERFELSALTLNDGVYFLRIEGYKTSIKLIRK